MVNDTNDYPGKSHFPKVRYRKVGDEMEERVVGDPAELDAETPDSAGWREGKVEAEKAAEKAPKAPPVPKS